MEVVALAIMGITNIVCFVVGAKVGLAVKKGNDIELRLPTANPIEHFHAKKEARKEQDRIDAIMANIEGYDGTSAGQRDIPRG